MFEVQGPTGQHQSSAGGAAHSEVSVEKQVAGSCGSAGGGIHAERPLPRCSSASDDGAGDAGAWAGGQGGGRDPAGVADADDAAVAGAAAADLQGASIDERVACIRIGGGKSHGAILVDGYGVGAAIAAA